MPNPSALVDAIRAAVGDTAVAAVAIEHDLEPIDGPGSAVSPPTYPSNDVAEHPYSPEGTVPIPSDGGWLTKLATGEDGRPASAPLVILDDVQAQSARASQALWEHRVELGGLPGFVLRSDEDRLGNGTNSVEALLADLSLSSWTLSHRHADSWIQTAAANPDGQPVWKSNDDGLADVLTGINSTVDATSAFTYAPNSLLYGFWLSADTVRRHRQARAYRTRIIGYGARPVRSGATKVDLLPISKASQVDRAAFGYGPAKTKGSKAKAERTDRPSNLGFGPNPGSVGVHGYGCERIAARGAISLQLLRSLQFGGDRAKQSAAATALTVLGLAGDVLLRRRMFLRSGCDLFATASRYGLWRQGRAVPETLPVDVAADVSWWAQALESALEDCRSVGLEFAAPVRLYLSEPQRKLVREGAEALRSGAPVEDGSQ
ncbi:type I-G CRISPR-associated protein Cas7 [Nocardia shimofusensis]|uniref:type I-G CRISPR-associated protein Cas7 n=1 Tax=Nocardia shimofusensis TaxID=228596 RepID=UPI000A00317D|nr:type I-U CRISPR-associated protein Cas7 [Nocardia shimofusensis]